MGFATRILFARQALFTPRLYHNTQHCHRLCNVTNARFSQISRRFPQMRHLSQVANDNSAPKFEPLPDHGQHSVKAIEQIVQEDTNSSAKRTGTVTCYETCGSTRWNLFRQAFDKLPVEQWENKVREGTDPGDLGVVWGLRTFQGGDDTSVVVLRRRFNGMPTVSGNLWVDEEEDEDDSDDSDDSDDWNDLDDEDDEKGTCGRSGLVKRRRCLLCPNLK